MTSTERATLWLRPVFFLARNGITLTGAVLTTAAGLTMIGFWGLEVLQLRPTHPYAGIVLFMVLPAVFVAGLILVPAGQLWQRRRLRAAGRLPQTYPKIDLHEPTIRYGLSLVAAATTVNVVILSTASYQAVDHMDSVQFCGMTCHSVMAPEYTAYLNSAHSRVACVQCHIGAGASWFVRSKLSGTRQVFAVTFNTHSRPIPSPVKHLRPARETCEQCHWPQKFHGDKFLVRTKFSDDEKNTPLTTVLVLKVGGRSASGSKGIHGRHLDPSRPIAYVTTDERRQVIPQVTYTDDKNEVVEFVSAEVKTTPEELVRAEPRQMDCMDCHNRPSHTFELPERAVDRAMAEGVISPELPYVKKQGVALLRADYSSAAAATDRIAAGLADFYKKDHPETYQKHRAQVETAARELVRIYSKNVFPGMRVGWGTYPNNIGHEDFLGCFRCHDDSHKSRSGRVITQDCEACHTILAQDESDPKILSDLGLK